MKPAAVILGIAFAGALGPGAFGWLEPIPGRERLRRGEGRQTAVELDDARLAWKIALPPGLSSPVLSRKLVFLTGLANGRLVTLAIDKADGKSPGKTRRRRSNLKKFTKPATRLPFDARR